MNQTKITLAIFFLLLSMSVMGQEEEYIKTDKGTQRTTITSSKVPGYNGTQNEEANSFFNKGVKLGYNGDFEGAIKMYKKAIKLDPSFVEAYDNAGLCYRRLSDYKNAIKYYKKSIELYPNGRMAHQNLAVVYGLVGEIDNALKMYKRIIEIDPNDAEGYYGMASIYMQREQFDLALENAHKALGIYIKTRSVHLADGYLMVGLNYYFSGDMQKAKKYLSLAKDHGAKLQPQIEESVFR